MVKPMIAKLESNRKILLKKSNLSNRLYSKSGFGKLDKNGNLRLKPLEAAYLLENKKIGLENMDFQSFFEHCIKTHPRFEIKYLVFRNLRKRGYLLEILEDSLFDFKIKGKQIKNQYITISSERDELSMRKILSFLKGSNIFLAAIVDEEGDITYYSFSDINLKGGIRKNVFPRGEGILLGDRVAIFEKNCAKELLEKEFFGKTFSEGTQLSFIEAAYLLEKKIIDIIDPKEDKKIRFKEFIKLARKTQPDIDYRLRVYRDLKERGLIIKTGFKFGTHFRVYKNDPDLHHAEYLVDVVNEDFVTTWSFLSKSVRLAHSVKKEMVFAIINNKHIGYIRVSWMRI
ncbi:tRNA-intron lyase [Euryarchaeota archaeon ex4484_162]|nr:MAG: tRNA-intron lyase [Euryarchaeota archaeon ex4484_162]